MALTSWVCIETNLDSPGSKMTSQNEDSDVSKLASLGEEGSDVAGRSEDAFREPCRQYVDVLMYCYSPANQISTYYRVGQVDDCKKQLNQLKLCLKLKMNRPEEERVQLYEELKRRHQFAPTSKIWEMRENPEKDWATSKW